MAVPVAALTASRRGLWAAYVAVPLGSSLPSDGRPDGRSDGRDATHRADRREVELLHADGAVAYVRGPLRPGERLVVAGVARLVPGLEIRTLDEGSPDTRPDGPPDATPAAGATP